MMKNKKRQLLSWIFTLIMLVGVLTGCGVSSVASSEISTTQTQQIEEDGTYTTAEEVAPGKSIGGSHYGNYEKALPDQEDRTYYECDLEYEGGYRGAERLIYSSDGLIYYTSDHYKTFTQLY